ncbi:MAG: 3-phosphoserine/phosphohydroxythreonine transaminase [Pyrinomonadaceae bacterium]
MRIYNFSSGPAMLPEPVLERAREEMLSLGGIGMSVMEISHRSDQFDLILHGAEQGIRDLLDIPSNYRVLFLQGGASTQFAMVPMTFLPKGSSADYVVAGYWGRKALAEANREGSTRVIWNGEESGFSRIPSAGEIPFSPDAAYVHYTSNETIDGVEFKYDLDAGEIPVICDACSNVLSKPIDIGKYAMIYAGAQKNIGPSGVTVVIIRDDMIAKVPSGLHPLLDYRALAESDSMVNTPNTWGIYLIGLICDWLKEQGGVAGIQNKNEAKAKVLYDAIDSSDGFYRGRAERSARSTMNVTFNLQSAELERLFAEQAAEKGMDGLAGHRTSGGIRASIYNAFPAAGVDELIGFMQEFAAQNS